MVAVVLLALLQVFYLLDEVVGCFHLVAAKFEAYDESKCDACSESGEQADGFRLAHLLAPEHIPYQDSEPEYDGGDCELEPLGVEFLVFGEFFGC